MFSDPALFFQQVVQQALSHIHQDEGAQAAPGDPSNETALIEILGNRLAAMFQPDASQTPDQNPDSEGNLGPGERAHYRMLLERNAMLAMALGACDCWGELTDCDLCLGAGKPGWALPDPYFFARLVRPGLQAIKVTSAGRTRQARAKSRGVA